MCALAKGNLMPGASSRLEAESPNDAGRYDGRGEDRGSPAELWRATRLSRLARPVSNNVTSLLFYTRYRGTPPESRGQTDLSMGDLRVREWAQLLVQRRESR